MVNKFDSQGRRAITKQVAQKPKPPVAGKQTKVSVLLDATLVQAIDAEAARMSAEQRLDVTRTDVVRLWLDDAARARKRTK